MRQAIEEKFILDVLHNYTPYKLAFKLAHEGTDFDDKEVERSAALKGIMGWVRLHPYNIAQKVSIMVEHFRQYVAPLLDGHAKAMVVVSNRVEAVRWQFAINKYIKSQGYLMRTLVAFSGEVKDKESGREGFTENSHTLNPNLKGRDIREAFKSDEYQILLVANKFQTGFDQPLLCGMYHERSGAELPCRAARYQRYSAQPFGPLRNPPRSTGHLTRCGMTPIFYPGEALPRKPYFYILW
jgi:type I restriction enzyme R subunit